jgi:hypothetical protein
LRASRSKWAESLFSYEYGQCTLVDGDPEIVGDREKYFFSRSSMLANLISDVVS